MFQRYRKGNPVLEKPILISVLRDFDLDSPECLDEDFRKLFRKDLSVLDNFRETKAFTLVKPNPDRTLDLTNTPDESLCMEFVKEKNEMKKYLMAKCKPLRATENRNISGRGMCFILF